MSSYSIADKVDSLIREDIDKNYGRVSSRLAIIALQSGDKKSKSGAGLALRRAESYLSAKGYLYLSEATVSMWIRRAVRQKEQLEIRKRLT